MPFINRLPWRLLVHTATPLLYEEPQTDPTTWIEGEPGDHGGGEPINGPAFACVLFMPGPGGEQSNPYRPKVIRSPTLLYNPTRGLARAGVLGDGSLVVVGHETELMITAPELAGQTGGETVRWQVDGDPQPFGPPGTVYGLQATVRQVRD